MNLILQETCTCRFNHEYVIPSRKVGNATEYFSTATNKYSIRKIKMLHECSVFRNLY